MFTVLAGFGLIGGFLLQDELPQTGFRFGHEFRIGIFEKAFEELAGLGLLALLEQGNAGFDNDHDGIIDIEATIVKPGDGVQQRNLITRLGHLNQFLDVLLNFSHLHSPTLSDWLYPFPDL